MKALVETISKMVLDLLYDVGVRRESDKRARAVWVRLTLSLHLNMYQVVAHSNLIADWINVACWKALALSMPNLVSDSLYDVRFGRERPKRGRAEGISVWGQK